MQRGAALGGMRRLLVIAEVALAFVLAAGAGLLGKSFLRLTGVDGGFDGRNVLTMTLTLNGGGHDTPDAARRYYQRVAEKVRAIPGVTGSGLVDNVPAESHRTCWRFALAGRAASMADVFRASPEYFAVLRIPLLRGSCFAIGTGSTGRQWRW